MPSSGSDFLTSGCEPSASRSNPSGSSWELISVRTLSGLTSFPKRALAWAAICPVVRLAVHCFQHQIQQARQLDGLAIGPADQRGRLAVAGTLRFADQLDAVGPDGDVGQASGGCGRRGGRRAVQLGRPAVDGAH